MYIREGHWTQDEQIWSFYHKRTCLHKIRVSIHYFVFQSLRVYLDDRFRATSYSIYHFFKN